MKSAITEVGKGNMLVQDDWGKNKIAYPIGKDNRAKWTYFRYKAHPDALLEFKRQFKINESVLRELTTKTEEQDTVYKKLKPDISKNLQELARSHTRFMNEVARKFKPAGRGGRRPYNNRKVAGHNQATAPAANESAAPTATENKAPTTPKTTEE